MAKKPQSHYAVSFEVAGDKLTTILNLLAGEVNNLHLQELAPTATPPRAPVRSAQGEDWWRKYAPQILKNMQPGVEYSIHDSTLMIGLSEQIVPSTIGTIMPHMTRAGLVARVGRGKYKAVINQKDFTS